MGFLFPSFDGPQRTSPYVVAPRRRRMWPIAAAFGAGVGCVLVLLAPWKHIGRAFAPAPAANEQATSSSVTPVEARQAEATPPSAPAPEPQASETPARTKASEAKPAEVKGPKRKTSRSLSRL
jgi:hypothetical protein